ncbi:hypothetical protein HXA34_20005 [Salipaludibacillus agaradhaerens]|jgi:hypothetical protein|uniref:hypothetical protein n=1 Tax=Salipaludibacillus agaradhaerens TaxID=76935 RepID=UPI002150F5FD|nr:hypothetical protein [Salipaludibacillus agaradhaerens]MCR6108575.1 hypothetical protein [Salipaludibacillus agaradhaerens]MCR6120604.1 hypothetical protein [Salipaludibacillus agaradhaerens]
MPANIKTEHVNRMFPFEFYDELSENLKGFTLLNPAFILRDQLKGNAEKHKELFEQSRANNAMTTLNQNNLMQVEPFGDLLMLDVCCPSDDIDTILNQRDKRSQSPLSIFVAQLYDSTGAPVFSKDVTEESIKRIPEVLWDDPNLFLGVVMFTEKEPRVAVIKIPKRIEGQLFENIKDGKL